MLTALKPEISFDYKNALANAVGSEGLDENELNTNAATAAVRAFRCRVTSKEVGFPELPNDHSTLKAVTSFADRLRPGIDAVLLLGIGGSALGAAALDCALRGPHPFQADLSVPKLVVLDNIDPGIVATALQKLNPKRTAVCVVTKSGSTAETMATFMVVREWMRTALGKRARQHIIAITDPYKGDLLDIARQENYHVFSIPPNVGGRFSIFSPAGLVPAALVGINVRKLLRGAADANPLCWQESPASNPALASALLHFALNTDRKKTIEVVFAYSSYLWGGAFWYRQLWAESLGKKVDRQGRIVETGQTPVPALGVTDQHSQLQLYVEGPRDKMITFWSVERPPAEVRIPRIFAGFESCNYLGGKRLSELLEAERIATEAALVRAARPNCRWTVRRMDEYTVGAFFHMLLFQTAFAGELFNVNAFDQPGVELGKQLTYSQLIARYGTAASTAEGLLRLPPEVA